jgi:acyl-CoA thioester hydrolase
METPPFKHFHRVTYADCTVENHVYYGRYLDILEAARGEFFRHLGVPLLQLQQQGTAFPVVECRLRYKGFARYDDVLGIEVWLSQAGGVRLNFSNRITDQNGKLILEAETLHVCAGLNEKPKRLPEELLARLRPHLRE